MTIANGFVRTGHLLGTGAAATISLGWIPKRVDVFNITDGTAMTIGFPGTKMIAFTSGGVAVPIAGTKLTGITSGATAKLSDTPLLISGTYAGGDAAGWFMADAEDVVGTFQSENVTFSGSAVSSDDATVIAQVEHALYQATTAGLILGTTATTGITSYSGSSTAAKGFTIGSTVSVSGKLLRWTAFRN